MGCRGKRLLASTVDFVAEVNPQRPFAIVPRGSELSDGFEVLRMKDVSRAVNALCWWLEGTVGESAKGEVLAYMGSNDVRYLLFVLACQKAGYEAFLPSTRNATKTSAYLLGTINCNRLFYSEEKKVTVSDVQSLIPVMQVVQIPSMGDLLKAKDDSRPYQIIKSYEESEDERACIIHSSGTTGMPKPLFLTHGFFSAMDSFSILPCPPGRRPNMFYDIGEPVLATTPFYHIMGFLSFVISIFHGTPVVFGPDKPSSAKHLIELMRITRPVAASFPPSILEDISASEEGLKCLNNMRYVFVGGAPLSLETGNAVAKCTQVIPMIGSSEIGWIPALVPESKDNWAYYEWNTAFGVEMRDTGDGLFELVIPRQEHSREFHGVFHLFPHFDVYLTNDLYTRHPTNPNLWKFYGRKDDLIVLSNGEKFNAVPLEQIIERSPLVQSAVIVGNARSEAALLIEPSSHAPDICSGSYIESIWPTVQEANHISPGHARIMKSRVKLASKDKPFKKTEEGSTQRPAVIQDYESEISEIYANYLAGELDRFPTVLPDLSNISEYIRESVHAVLEKADIPDQQDLYNVGLDSLTTPELCIIIQKGIQNHHQDINKDIITPQKIYENPTIERLSRVIVDTIEGNLRTEIPRKHKIQTLVERYTANLPRIEHPFPIHTSGLPSTIMLTGSTGSLRTYLLHFLVNTPSISKICCLNRSKDSVTRRGKAFQEKGIFPDCLEWSKKVEFVNTSLGESKLGLQADKYKELLQSVDTVIHVTWKVDFNQTIDTFEDPHIKGVRQLVDFSIHSYNHAHIHFISSVVTSSNCTSGVQELEPGYPTEDSTFVLEK